MNYILAIGIDNYKNCTILNNAVRDINNITDILTTQYDFEKKEITLLIDEEATLENIINELEILISKQTAADNLLILFSGHGDYDEILQMGYLIPSEAVPHSKSTYLPYSTLFSYIKALNSHHILLISDSCYSGSVFSPVRAIETSKEKLDKIPSKWAITSGRIEPVSDGEPGKNSPFAEALINLLNNSTEDLLGISEISNKIIAEVAGKVDQIPRGEPLQLYGHKGGEFMFHRRKDPKEIKKIKTESDNDERGETLSLINSNYELEFNIEEAENENKVGTIRRLNKEKESLINILNKELLKELEIKRTILSQSDSLDILSEEYMAKYKELLAVKKLKNDAVKNQKYEEAAKIRDDEKKLERQLNAILDDLDLRKIIKFSQESLYKDYFIVQIILDNQNYKFEKRKLIENLFARLLFFDLSFKNGYISQYIYTDFREKLVITLKEQFE